MKKRALRIEPYDPDPIDRDGDGIVQEGTAWERPAGTRLLDVLGREIVAGATSETRPKGSRVVDQSGKTVKYMASYEAGQSLDRSIGDRFRRVGDAVGGTLGQRLGGLNVSRNPPRPDFPTTVNVVQPGGKAAKRKLRERIVNAFRKGEKWEKVDKPFDDYTPEEKQLMLESIVEQIPFLSTVAGDKSLSVDEKMENIIRFMEENADELARQSGMLDEKGQLTEKAEIARQWYRVANNFNTTIADEVGIRHEAVHAVTAIFSATTDWELNTAIAANATRVMAENPEITETFVEDIYKSTVASLNTNIGHKKKNLADKRKEYAKLKELETNPNLTPEEKLELQTEIQKLDKSLARLEKNLNDKKAKLKETKAFATSQDWFASKGGQVGKPLMDQPPDIGGRFLKMQEEIGLNDGKIRNLRFHVNPDSTYEISVLDAEGVSKHNPERVHANVFKVLKAGFEGDEEKLYEEIQSGLGEGNKVRSFYNNMSDPDESDLASVTIDTHQAGLLLGVPGSAADDFIDELAFKPNTELGGPAGYAAMNEATARFARKHGLLPREAQSILWEAQRQMWNIGNSPDKKKAKEKVLEKLKEKNLTPAQIRKFLWDTRQETFGQTLEKPPKLYTGNIQGYLPDGLSVRDAPENTTPIKKSAAKKGARKKVAGTRKAAPAKATPVKATPAKATPQKASPKKVAAKKTAAKKAAARAVIAGPSETSVPITRNNEVLSRLTEGGSSEFAKPDKTFVDELNKKFPNFKETALTKVFTNSEITDTRIKNQNFEFDRLREFLKEMTPEQLTPNSNGMIIVDGNAMHPDVADFISNSSNEEIAQALSETAKTFTDGVDRKIRVRMRGGQSFRNFIRDGRYKTTHDEGVAATASSQPDIRSQYEASLGILPDAAPELRPASGYVIHKDWDSDAKLEFEDIYGFQPEEHHLLDARKQSGPVDGYGGIEIVLKEDVAERSAWGKGDSLKRWLHPSRFNEEDPDLILNSLILNQGNQGLSGDPADDALRLLEARRKGNFVDFNDNGLQYFEALVPGSFVLDEVSEIRVPYFDFQNLDEDPEDIVKNVIEEFFSTERLRKLGLSEEEIKYILNSVDEETKAIDLSRLRANFKSGSTYKMDDLFPKGFTGDFSVKDLLTYRRAKDRVSQLESSGVKTTLIETEINYRRSNAKFSRLDPRHYGVESEEEIEAVLIKNIVDRIEKEVKNKMKPENEEVDRFPGGLG